MGFKSANSVRCVFSPLGLHSRKGAVAPVSTAVVVAHCIGASSSSAAAAASDEGVLAITDKTVTPKRMRGKGKRPTQIDLFQADPDQLGSACATVAPDNKRMRPFAPRAAKAKTGAA